MMKNFLGLMAFGLALPLYAQQRTAPPAPPEQVRTENSAPQRIDTILSNFRKNMHLNLLLRSSLELPGGGQSQGGVRLNEGRIELRGNLLSRLGYRVRFRLNRPLAPTSQDNASSSIDHFSATYSFGRTEAWSLTVGKQSAMVGSWEFDNNPTFEYQYSEFVNRQLNLFLTAVKLAYDINDNHTVALQVHNTYNNDFAGTLQSAGYTGTGLRAAKLPVGLYVSWLGNLFDKKLLTFYSYNISYFADGKPNHQVAIGNKVILSRFHLYLDLATSTYGIEHFNIASPAINAYRTSVQPGAEAVFAENLNYKNAILRVDYEFTPGWFITAKGIWESASHRNRDGLGANFRTHTGYLAGLEYKPVKTQDMRLFTYYYTNEVAYQNDLVRTSPPTRQNLVGVGLLYFINAL